MIKLKSTTSPELQPLRPANPERCDERPGSAVALKWQKKLRHSHELGIWVTFLNVTYSRGGGIPMFVLLIGKWSRMDVPEWDFPLCCYMVYFASLWTGRPCRPFPLRRQLPKGMKTSLWIGRAVRMPDMTWLSCTVTWRNHPSRGVCFMNSHLPQILPIGLSNHIPMWTIERVIRATSKYKTDVYTAVQMIYDGLKYVWTFFYFTFETISIINCDIIGFRSLVAHKVVWGPKAKKQKGLS
jgi:hypothetical protein